MSRFAALFFPLALAACGPSMKHLVESDMRFEHCYRIDEDPSTPLDNKRTCWRDWTAHYAKGQDRSRIHYAKERVKVLANASHGPVATAPQPVATAAPVSSPPPLNPYAPPPSVAPKEEKSAATPTTAACSDACSGAWKTCTTPCGAAANNCVVDCDVKFRACVKACL